MRIRHFMLALGLLIVTVGSGIDAGRVAAQELDTANQVDPKDGRPGTTVTVFGTGFGKQQDGSQITIDGKPITEPATLWQSDQVVFVIPEKQPGGADWPDKDKQIKIGLKINGTTTVGSEIENFTVEGPKSSFRDILAGLVLLIILIVAVWWFSGRKAAFGFVTGADGRPSTSKLQWAVWTGVVLVTYAAIYIARVREGDYSAITDVPTNVLIALGLSATTMTTAQAITVNYVSKGRVTKTAASTAGAKATGWGAIFADDDGNADLSKIQIIGWTLVAVGAYCLNVVHQINQIHRREGIEASLPDIDTALLVLMGLAQGSYVGKKLVSAQPPVTMTTGSVLAAGVVGQPYQQPLQASGGTPPYTWTLVGTLPAGLTLDSTGAIGGTPTAAGTSSFSLQVTDSVLVPPTEVQFTIVIA